MTLAAGDYLESPRLEIKYVKNGGAAAVSKGVVMRWDPTNDGFSVETADSSILGPFAVCVEAAAASATQVLVCTHGTVAVTADGTIEPYDLVQMSSSTDGQVVAYVEATIDTTPTQADVQEAMREHRRIVGTYVGKEGTGDGVIVADAADGDVILVDLDLR